MPLVIALNESIFGTPKKMPFDLPPGWRWHASTDDFLYAYDPHQRKYLVAANKVREIQGKHFKLDGTLLGDVVNPFDVAE